MLQLFGNLAQRRLSIDVTTLRVAAIPNFRPRFGAYFSAPM